MSDSFLSALCERSSRDTFHSSYLLGGTFSVPMQCTWFVAMRLHFVFKTCFGRLCM